MRLFRDSMVNRKYMPKTHALVRKLSYSRRVDHDSRGMCLRACSTSFLACSAVQAISYDGQLAERSVCDRKKFLAHFFFGKAQDLSQCGFQASPGMVRHLTQGERKVIPS